MEIRTVIVKFCQNPFLKIKDTPIILQYKQFSIKGTMVILDFCPNSGCLFNEGLS